MTHYEEVPGHMDNPMSELPPVRVEPSSITAFTTPSGRGWIAPEEDSMTHYKATRLDGTDFFSGRVNYGSALLSGEPVEHPVKIPWRLRDLPPHYLSVATVPTGCEGMKWPCRLFRVEPAGRLRQSLSYPHVRGVAALRVVEELPGHMALGPQGEHVAALIERTRLLTDAEVEGLRAAWDAARDAAWDAAWDAARDAAWDAALDAARDAAWDAAWGAAWNAAWDAARGVLAVEDAILALLVRDLLAPVHYRTLTAPWAQVVGPVHPDDCETP